MPGYDYLQISKADAIPSPQEIIKAFPCSKEQGAFLAKSRQTLANILSGHDSRFLLIVGPCSIHDEASILEYAHKLKNLSKSVCDVFYLVMRAYFEKPRTSIGWKGLLYDPKLDGSDDIASGITLTRKILVELAEMQVPTASEFLDLASAWYFADLISWGCIGARTAASQTHRQLASLLPMPVAFKNTTEGSVDIAINGILSAALPHSFIGADFTGKLCRIKSKGNTHGHLVLRGSEQGPNYDPESIASTQRKLEEAGLSSNLLVDCSHDNSFRQYDRQAAVFQSVIKQYVENNANIRGVLLESHLHAGNQPIRQGIQKPIQGISITDPCLNWEATERLVQWGYACIKQARSDESQNTEPQYVYSKKR